MIDFVMLPIKYYFLFISQAFVHSLKLLVKIRFVILIRTGAGVNRRHISAIIKLVSNKNVDYCLHLNELLINKLDQTFMYSSIYT